MFKKILILICRYCPFCVLKRKYPDFGLFRYTGKYEELCPFCKAYKEDWKEKVEQNHALYEERKKMYLKQGMNTERMVEFIIGCAGDFSEPILDVGTGKGYMAVGIAKTGRKLTTIDIATEELHTARLNADHYGVGRNIRFLNKKAHASGFKKGAFAAIFCINAVHHFGKPYMVFDELIALLKKGGKLIIGDLNENGMRVVEKIHQSEGKFHKKTGLVMQDVESYFKDQPGLNLKHFEGENEIVLVIEKI